MNMIKRMIKEAIKTKNQAYAPYSKFKVGACIAADKETFFVGCNVENVAYGSTLCAEAVAIGNMISSNHQIIQQIVIVSNHSNLCAPCGNCRQLIQEFSTPKTQIHLCKGEIYQQTFTIQELLPLAFDKTNLLI